MNQLSRWRCARAVALRFVSLALNVNDQRRLFLLAFPFMHALLLFLVSSFDTFLSCLLILLVLIKTHKQAFIPFFTWFHFLIHLAASFFQHAALFSCFVLFFFYPADRCGNLKIGLLDPDRFEFCVYFSFSSASSSDVLVWSRRHVLCFVGPLAPFLTFSKMTA